jgi:hypothetical protein
MEYRGGSILGKRAAPEDVGGGSGAINIAPDTLGFSLQVGAQEFRGLSPLGGPQAHQRPLASTEMQVQDVGPASISEQVKRSRSFG